MGYPKGVQYKPPYGDTGCLKGIRYKPPNSDARYAKCMIYSEHITKGEICRQPLVQKGKM